MRWFASLTIREQFLLAGGSCFLVVLGLWLYVWQPITADRAAQSDRIARYLAVMRIVRDADTITPVALKAPANTTPLAPRITQSAEGAGIPLARLDPDGPRLRVTVAQAGFVEVTKWIASLEARDAVRAVSIEMSRLTEPGQVSLRMTLEDAG